MKILCVIDSIGSGGAQRQLVELALGFKEKGHFVTFLTYHDFPFYNNVLIKNAIPITCIQEERYLKRLLKMRHFIRNGEFDAVLSFLESPNLICEIAGLPFRNWKLVVGERNADPKISKSVKLKLYRWFHVFADFIVANSFTNLNLVRSVNPLLPLKKCKVIYNIIDFNRWRPNNNIKNKNAKLKLVVAASQSYRKNLNGLISAIALLEREEISKLAINWYGDRITEPYSDGSFIEAGEKIKTYNLEDVITFHPATHEISTIFQKSDAIGLFSFYEGLPNSVIEGMACGKPVICSAVSDIPLLLAHDSNLLFDPSDSTSIAKSLRYLIHLGDEQLLQIGKRNEVIVKERFSKADIVNMYLKLLSK